jgi:phage FluMu gp28-like protein
MKYDVIYDDMLDQLIKKVNHAAAEGWQPTGSPVIVISQHLGAGNMFFQTITK